jgi:hypothetical protein
MADRRSQIDRYGEHSTNAWTVRSCFATLKMQAYSAETSASRKNRINKALNQYDQVPVQLLKEAYSYTVSSTVRVTACRNQRLNTAICKWWGNGRGLSEHLFYIRQGYPAPLPATCRGIEPTGYGAKHLYDVRVIVTPGHLPASTASIFTTRRCIFVRNVNIRLTDFTVSKYQP